jgi:putative ABC transport system ATP-binding protein
MVNGRIVSNVCPKTLVKIVKVLKRVKELEGLSDMTLTRVAERMAVERRGPGDTVVREGAESDRIYLIGEGFAEVYSDGQLKRELTVGEPFGVISAVSHHRIPETVRARTGLELYVLNRDDLDRVMADDKGFEERIRVLLMGRQAF